MNDIQEKKCFEDFIGYLEIMIEGVEKGNRLPFEKEAEIYYCKKILSVAKQFEEFSRKNNTLENSDSEMIQKLKKENEELRKKIEKNKFDKVKTAHEIISEIIAEKVYSTVRSDLSKYTKTSLKREIMEALKWHLQVRYADDLKDEHIEQAKKFIADYEINKFYK